MSILLLPTVLHKFTDTSATYNNEDKLVEYKSYLAKIDSLQQAEYIAKNQKNSSIKKPWEENEYSYSTEKNTAIQLNEFNPNTISKEEFAALGFKPFVIDNIFKYRDKGGKYKSKAQFKKVYGLSDEKYTSVEPYLLIDSSKPKQGFSKSKSDIAAEPIKKEQTIKYIKFNPNNTSDEVWKQLGVSDFVVANVKKYLATGANYKLKNDFKKVYSLSNEDYLKLEPYIDLPEAYTEPSFAEKEFETKEFKKDKPAIVLFEFDPNTASIDDWKNLGINEKTIQTIKNYLSTGASFKTNEDLQKVYNLSNEDFLRLQPYVKIPQKELAIKLEEDNVEPAVSKPKIKEYETNIIIDINSADANEFQKLKGIGPTFSERIVKYRNDLGGFVSKEQLAEVYGISDSLYQALQPRISITNQPINQIDINSASIETFSKHPYISDKLADHIVTFRYGRNGFKKVKDLKRAYMITDKIYKKIEPYLTVTKKESAKNMDR